MKSHPPKSDTSFDALGKQVDFDLVEHVTVEEKSKPVDTDFHTLQETLEQQQKPYQHRTITDLLIDGMTPILIFVMVYSVIFFLLEVRFIFSEVHDANLKFVAFSFILGIVALNRLVASDSSDESLIYVAGLAGAVGLYTIATTGAYGVGSVARNFMDSPWIATFFNMTVVGVIWWTTNRLMHECCIDENFVAGDVGILTGTIRRFQKTVQRDKPVPGKKERKRRADHLLESMDIEDFDPLEWTPEKKTTATIAPPTERMPKRHPGMSVLYFSVPVMVIFALGLPALRAGGEGWVKAGHLYVAVYTVSALFLLMLTSLGGLREYFRARRVYFPKRIGPFWVGLGIVMIAIVCVGALQMPQPPLPDMAIIDDHEVDFFSRGSTFRLKNPSSVTAAEKLEQANALEYISRTVLVILGLFFSFFLLRGLGEVAALVGRNRDRFPPRVVRFFDRLDAVLVTLVRVPKLPSFKTRPRISRHVATCVQYNNPMRGEGLGSAPSDVASYIASSYDALCALAQDMGVPREKDQTPYEFIDSFPKVLKSLKREAAEITEMYVRSSYSDIPIDGRSLDRLRKFWVSYEKVRNRVVR